MSINAQTKQEMRVKGLKSNLSVVVELQRGGGGVLCVGVRDESKFYSQDT